MNPTRREPSFAFLPAALVITAIMISPAHAQFVEPDVTALQTFTGMTGATFGWAVADLKDIDGDGVTDVIIGAPFDTTNGASAGRAFVYSGRTGALLYTLNGQPQAQAQFGYAVADAGDVNADGIHDIIVGAPNVSGGRAFVYSGATGALMFTLTGAASGDAFGAAVCGLGDVNHDGRGDVAVGGPSNDAPAVNAGRVYIYSGNGTHPLLRVFNGPAANAQFGRGVGNAGDIDHDGVNDLIVSAPPFAGPPRGRAYVYSGATGVQLLPELQPDPTGSMNFGTFFVAGIGDANGDGTPDLYVGDYGANGGDGKAYVFSGADGSRLFTFPGALGSGEGVGPGRGAGDINRDGHADIIVGSYTSSAGAPGAGSIHIYSGLDGSLLRTITSNVAGINLGFDAVGIGDTNGDCAIDLLCSAASGDTVYIIAGSPISIPADLNCDCKVDINDIDPFVTALLDPAGFATTYVGCDINRGDLNSDGRVDGADIPPFAAKILLGA